LLVSSQITRFTTLSIATRSRVLMSLKYTVRYSTLGSFLGLPVLNHEDHATLDSYPPRCTSIAVLSDAHAPQSVHRRQSDRVRLREQYLDRRPQRRHRPAADELPGRERQPEALARWLARRIQRHVWRQRRRLRRAVSRRRAEAPNVAPRRGRGAGLDAGRQEHPLLLRSRGRRAAGRATLLHHPGRGWRRGADADAACVSGQDLPRR